MIFNAIKYLQDFNIDYITDGKNTSPDFLNINCVFPGCNDDGYHLGIHKKNGYANCWKCGHHSLYEIIKKLTPDENTKDILNKYKVSNQIIKKKETRIINTTIIIPGGKLERVHKKYLLNRNFDPVYIEKKYDLRGTKHLGDYAFRIITPIYYKGKIVTFQGRDITNQQKSRYKACEKENEIIPISDILYNLDNCKKDFVIVTEGTFDVFRLGDNSCCTFGKNYSNKQLKLLSNFKRVYIWFDPDDPGKKAAMKLNLELSGLGIESFIIESENDPADSSPEEVKKFLKELI